MSIQKIWIMKKSNLIILSTIGAIFIFSITFQLTVNRHLRHSELKKEIINRVTEQRTVKDFTKISVSHGIEVYFTQDSIHQIKIDAPKSSIHHINTKVKNDKLIIENSNKNRRHSLVKVFVSNAKLEGLEVYSDAYFETIGEVSGKALKLEFSSNTKANLELSYDQVECKAESGSQVKFRGNTSNIEFSN